MGVSGLGKVISKYAPKSIHLKKMEDYCGTVQGMDASFVLYHFCIAISDKPVFYNSDGNIVGHLLASLSRTCSMLSYGILPVWIFDGKPPQIKQEKIMERRRNRTTIINKTQQNLLPKSKGKIVKFCKGSESDPDPDTVQQYVTKKKFSITKFLINDVKYLLYLMGIPYIESPEEADAQCSACNIAQIIDGVISDDWDIILFGSNKMLKDFSKDSILEIDSNKLLSLLGMESREQLIDLGILLGTDYCKGIYGLSKIKIYEIFKECNFNIDLFIHTLRLDYPSVLIPEEFGKNYDMAREYYLNAPVINPQKIKNHIMWTKPKYDMLSHFLITEKKMNSFKCHKWMSELKQMYESYIPKLELSVYKYQFNQVNIKNSITHSSNKIYIDSCQSYNPSLVQCQNNSNLFDGLTSTQDSVTQLLLTQSFNIALWPDIIDYAPQILARSKSQEYQYQYRHQLNLPLSTIIQI